MRDLWTSRDLPVLQAYARLDQDGSDLFNANDDVAAALGLTTQELDRSLRKLTDAQYLETGTIGAGPYVTDITERGLRTVGAWPSEQTALDRMIAALDAIAEHTDDTDTRSTAQKFAAWLRSSSTTVGLSVASAVITGQLPGQ